MIRDITLYLVKKGPPSTEPDEYGNFTKPVTDRIKKKARAYPMSTERMQLLYGGLNRSATIIRTRSPITEPFDHIEIENGDPEEENDKYRVDARSDLRHFSIFEVSKR